MSSKQSISKHRTGGGPQGGHSQSNPRQSDYNRQPTERFAGHNMRQPSNTMLPPHHIQMQVTQPTANVIHPNQTMANPQLLNRFPNNNAPLITQPQISIQHQHANPPPTTGMTILNQQQQQARYPYGMQQNASRINPQTRPPLSNYIRPTVPNPGPVPNYPQHYQYASSYYSQPGVYTHFQQPSQPPSNLAAYYYPPQLMYFDQSLPQFKLGIPSGNQPMNNNEINNAPFVKQNDGAEQAKKGKREKKPIDVFDEFGHKVDLFKLANNQSSSITNTPEKPIEAAVEKTAEPVGESINGANNNTQQPQESFDSKSMEENVIRSSSDKNDCNEESENPISPINDEIVVNQDVESKTFDENSSSCDMVEEIGNISPTTTTTTTTTSINESKKENDEINELASEIEQIDLKDHQESNVVESVVEDIVIVDVVENNQVSQEEEPSTNELNDDKKVNKELELIDEIDHSKCENTIDGDVDIKLDFQPTESSLKDETKPMRKTSSPTVDENQPQIPDKNGEIKIEAEIKSINHEHDNETNATDKNLYQYDREFIYSLRHNASECALTNSNQDNIKDIIRKDPSSHSSSHSNPDALLPNFAKNSRIMNDQQFYRNKSQQAPTFRRTSQPSRNYLDSKSRKIASTSLHEHHNYNDDAWRPGKTTATSPEAIETETLLKSVRAIFNKLTPQNYKTLLDQFKKLKIDSKDRLTKVIDLIFETAVGEPAFVVQYAGFCSELIHIKVTEENEKNEHEQVKFKNLLIEKCQKSFYEKIYVDVKELANQVEETEDPVKRKELEDQLDYEKRLSRKRSVGNIKLIAELYKLNMLNAKIMFNCFEYLIRDNSSCEEYIECLCALITNIGKNLTDAIKTKMPDQASKFKSVFEDLEKIYHNQSELKVSSRIRFMILDLLDLRKNDWVPRRQKEGPKMIAQVHEDMEMQNRLKNESLNDMRNNKKKNPVQQQDDWQQVKQRKSHSSVNTKNHLNHLMVLKDISENRPSTGIASLFKSGSHGGSSTSHSQNRSSSTNYESKNQVFSNDRNQRAFHDSLNANSKNQYSRRDDRKIPEMGMYQMDKRSDSSHSQTRSDSLDRSKSVPQISDSEFRTKVESTVTKAGGPVEFRDILNDINSYCSRSKYADFISYSILCSIEKTSPTINPREKWGRFLGKFLTASNCQNGDLFEGLKSVFGQFEDFILDIPKYFEYIGEVIGYALLQNCEENPSGKQEIIKTVVQSYLEISGNQCKLFSDALLKTVSEISPDLHKEIAPMFFPSKSEQVKSKDELDGLINDYFKNLDVNELKNQIEKKYSDSISSESFKSALYSKLLTCALSTNTDQPAQELARIRDVIKTFVVEPRDQVLFLVECSNLNQNMHHPSKLLNEIFAYLLANKLIDVDSFKEWKKQKGVSGVSIINVQRFLSDFIE